MFSSNFKPFESLVLKCRFYDANGSHEKSDTAKNHKEYILNYSSLNGVELEDYDVDIARILSDRQLDVVTLILDPEPPFQNLRN
jgi:hypothetical protein